MMISTFSEAQQALRQFYANSRTPYTLDVMRQLMTHLDDPQNKLKIIHVAGTSGKTSTAYYAAALLRASGKRIGLTVSPHVDTLGERAQINAEPLPETEFCAALDTFLRLVAQASVAPSYFEVMVAFAYWLFVERDMEYAVVEVGLGGMLDGTNVIERPDKMCVITDIGFDHTEVLGNTLAKIAAQKAGIITKQNDVYMHEQGEEVMQAVRTRAKAMDGHLHIAPENKHIANTALPLVQIRNLQLAAAAVDGMLRRETVRLSEVAISAAAHVQVPARLEYVQRGSQTYVLDGSHNQQKTAALIRSLRDRYPQDSIAVLAGFVNGPDYRWQGALDELIKVADYCIFTAFYGEMDFPKTSVEPRKLAAYCQQRAYTAFEIAENPVQALQMLQKRPEPVLVATGSFYLLNHIRPEILTT